MPEPTYTISKTSDGKYAMTRDGVAIRTGMTFSEAIAELENALAIRKENKDDNI